MKKKVMVWVLAAMMVVGLCVPVHAADAGVCYEYTGDYCPVTECSIELPQPIELPYGPEEARQSVKYNAPGNAESLQLLCELEQLVKAAILAGETSVDVSSYRIYPSALNLNTLYKFSPYFSSDFQLRAYYYSNSYYSHIQIATEKSPAEAAEYFASVDRQVAKVSALVNKGATAFDKALIFHDYLAYNCQYDQSSNLSANSHRSAGVIMDGIGVCDSYAHAYMYIMTLAGIECYVTSSDSINHAWNIIKINGNYYHVDVTWDDKVPDTIGKVDHDHFLVSDSAIASRRGGSSGYHYGWDRTDLVCSDESYDNAFWYGVESSIIDDGGYYYFIRDGAICKRSKTGGQETALVDLGVWKTWSGGGYWVGAFSGISLQNRDIYYNTSTQIRKINIDSLQDSLVLEPDTSEGYIFGNAIKGGMLRYVLKKDANESGTIYSRDVSELLPQLNISIEPKELQLEEEQSFTFSVIGAAGALSWKSGDENIASVSADGTVTAKAAGSTTITVSDENGTSASCALTVVHIHAYGASVTEPDCETGGYTIHVCRCGDSYKTDEREPLGHLEVVDKAVAAGCTEAGLGEGIHCSRCGLIIEEQEIIPATGHDWAESSYKEPTEEAEGWRIYVCGNCGEERRETIPVLDHVHRYTFCVTSPTCYAYGYTSYTCACGHSYTDSWVGALGHAWDGGKVTTAPTQTSEGVKTHTCTRCGATTTETLPKLEHEHSYESEVIAPTCYAYGYTSYTCACGHSYTDSWLGALGHAWDGGKVTTAPTQTSEGVKTHTCTRCGATATETLPKLDHEHSYESEVIAPGCTSEGGTIHRCACGHSYTDSRVGALGHAWDGGKVTTAPTQTSEGVKTHTCTRCGATATETLPKLDHEHSYTSEVITPTCEEDGYTIHSCVCGESYTDGKVPATGHKWDDGRVTIEPTMEAEGEKTFTCTVCGETETETVDKLPKPEPEPIKNPFKDVSETDYYFEPVMWAVQNGVTSGLSADAFGPAAGCTRAQVVTFLWRAAGEPAPRSSNNPFRDVKMGQYYYDAVLWAVENGITSGLSADTFGPDANCNRGQIVTFLWRANGKPVPKSSMNPFADVEKSQYYYDAVLWAVENGITSGMSADSFAPDNTCTRGQIVTFLCRAYK